MEGIPSIYWMGIFGILTGFICFVLYQLGMLIKDGRGIVVKAGETVSEVNSLVRDVSEIVGGVKGMVTQVNSALLVPLKKISSLLSVASSFTEGLSSRK